MLGLSSMVLAPLSVSAVRAEDKKPREHTVEIKDFLFSPESLTVGPGDTVTWINRDIAPHTATAEDGSWDTGELKWGESKSLVIGEGQAQPYICLFHPSMKGKLVAA